MRTVYCVESLIRLRPGDRLVSPTQRTEGRLDPGLAILLIEHDMDVVFDVVDHISVLHFGEVVEEGATEKIRRSEKVQHIYLGTG